MWTEMEVEQANDGVTEQPVCRAKKRKLLYGNAVDLGKPLTKNYVDEAFTNLQSYMKTLFTKKVSDCPLNDFDTMLKRVSESTSPFIIIESAQHLELSFGDDKLNGIKCKLCYGRGDNVGFCKFIDDGMGLQFGGKAKNQRIQNRNFKALKTSVTSHLCSQIHGIRTSRPVTEIDDVVTKSYLNNHIESLKACIDDIYERFANVTPLEKPKTLKSIFSKVRSLTGILEACKHLKLHYTSDEDSLNGIFDGVTCNACFDAAQNTGTAKPNLKGFFKYSADLGSDFTHGLMREEFRHLKDTIASHLKLKSHCKNAMEDYEPTTSETEFQQRSHKAGMTLGKFAYKSIVKTHNKSSFEEDVALLYEVGADVGDINHSSEFVTKLLPHCYSVLHEEMMTVLNNPVLPFLKASPFVVFADKMTVNGTTLQIIGITMFRDGKNTPLLLDVIPVKHHTGAALAEDIYSTLIKFYTPEALKSQYVGLSCDGQYLILNVAIELLRLIGVEVDSDLSKDELKDEMFQTFSWDPAHSLELSGKDVKKSGLHPWVEKTERAIVLVNNGNSIGKQLLKLIEEASLQNTAVMRPGSFSETRFCSYKHQVLRRFLHNYPALFNKLSKDEDCELNLINNCAFCLRLCGLVDIFKIIGKTSKEIQSSEIYPWQCDSIIEDCLEELQSMDTALQSEPYNNDHITFAELNDGLREITTSGTFKGKGIYFRQQVAKITRQQTVELKSQTSFQAVIKKVVSEIRSYVRAIREALRARYEKNNSAKAFFVSRESFQLQKILNRTPGEVPEEFEDYCTLAVKGGFLHPEIHQMELNKQYKLFSELVHTTYNNYLNNNGCILPEESLYWEILQSDSEIKLCNTLVDLLVSAIVRNKSECCAESLGSLIKIHLERRGSLSMINLRMELFCHFNGPKPNADCNGLVEKAMNKRYGKDGWHVIRKSHPSDLKTFTASKVIDRVQQKKGKIAVKS